MEFLVVFVLEKSCFLFLKFKINRSNEQHLGVTTIEKGADLGES
jgi:hypothetical protein